MDDRENLRRLAADYYVRDLSDEELNVLENALRADDELRRYFMDAGGDEWLMRLVHKTPAKIIHFEPRHKQLARIRKIAASVAVILTLGLLYVSQHTAIENKLAEVAINAEPIASVAVVIPSEHSGISAVHNGRVRQLKFGSSLFSGDRIVIPGSCALTFSYRNEDTVIELGEDSVVSIHDRSGAKLIQLNRGELSADVAKQTPGKPMQVKTHDAAITVVGTSFEVIAREYTRLAVSSGLVKFTAFHDGNTIEVSAGKTVSSIEQKEGEKDLHRVVRLNPVHDEMYNRGEIQGLLYVDAQRNAFSLLKFDLENFEGEIASATLRLRAVQRNDDEWGNGTFRVSTLPPETDIKRVLKTVRTDIGQFTGRVDAGNDLVIQLDPAQLKPGLNALVVSQDKGGNDCWFSSSEGVAAPELELHIEGDSGEFR